MDLEKTLNLENSTQPDEIVRNQEIEAQALNEVPVFYSDLSGKPKRGRFRADISFNNNIPSVVEYVDGVIDTVYQTITFNLKGRYTGYSLYRGVYNTTNGNIGIIYASLENSKFYGFNTIVVSVSGTPTKARIRVYNTYIVDQDTISTGI